MITKSCAAILIAFVICLSAAQAGDELCPKRPVVKAEEWVAAWKIAGEACPEATALSFHFVDRSGPTLRDAKIFNSVDIIAAGELLVIVAREAEGKGESVTIVRAVDMIRLEITKP